MLNIHANAVRDAILELKVAENFFNMCDTHQFDYANARLTSAIEKVNTAVKEAKEIY